MRIYDKMFLLVVVMSGMVILSCNSTQQKAEESQKLNSLDFETVHTYARPDQAVVEHLDLDVRIRFEEKQITGKASYKIQKAEGVDTIIFDMRELNIQKVMLDSPETATEFVKGGSQKYLGRPLKIKIRPETEWVHIYYETGPDADALQWLEPKQTAEGTDPFLFTQSQAVLARTWIPCQDAPGIRYTYNATVQVPPGLLALMSAKNPTERNKEEGIYHFEMKQPIPSYLMALAVGNIEYRALSDRTGVYAEPSVIEDAAYELAKMEEMMKTAEKLYGPYQWDKYNVIILPPSFPFGGMENPRLTFATPTILAGDRSLTSLIAHELAHSWSGNLVTNATWNDLWLNEGFTVYIERRLMEELYGKSYVNMLEFLGYQHLKEKTKQIMQENKKDTRLHMDLRDRNPDEGLSVIPYEKGALFLKTIEHYVGRQRFDQFLKSYFDTFAFKSMNSKRFVSYLNAHLIQDDSILAGKLKINDWIYGPGIPDNHPKIKSKRFQKVAQSAKKWEEGTAPEQLNTEDWTTHEWIYFLSQLPDSIVLDRMVALDSTFHFTKSTNSEILADWLELSIKSNYRASYDRLEAFLFNVGRRKFLRPLYKALSQTKEGKEWARQVYRRSRPNYHAVSRHTIDKILDWDKGNT